MKNIIYEKDGHNWVNISDLKPHPENDLYDDETAEDKKQQEIADDFIKRVKQGLPPNTQHIRIWEDGTIHSGHSRVDSAEVAGITALRAEYTDKPYPDGADKYADVENLLSENLYRKETYWVILGKYNRLTTRYLETNGEPMPVSLRTKLEKSYGTTYKTLKWLNEIKESGRKDLMADIVAGKSVEHCWKDATNQLMKHIPKKVGGLNLFKLIDDGMKSRIISKAVTHVKNIRNVRMSFEFGEVNPFDSKDLRWESGAQTAIISHSVMTATAGIFKEKGYKVQTSTEHPEDPDIRLKKNPSGTDIDEKIEVKVTQFNGPGSLTTWKGGQGSRGGEFILVAHDLEFKEIFVMMSTLTDKDWKSSGNRGGTHMPLSLWWQNHKDKDDYVFWKGRIANLKTNRKREEGIAQIIFEEVDAHPCH
jgi:hypothetical protein